MTKSYHINELAISLILYYSKEFNFFWCVNGSLLFFQQAPQIEKEKERKILEILKNHLGQFHKLNNYNRQLHTISYCLSNISITKFMNSTSLCCKYAIVNLSNS